MNDRRTWPQNWTNQQLCPSADAAQNDNGLQLPVVCVRTKRRLASIIGLTSAIIGGSAGPSWAIDTKPDNLFGRVGCGDVHTCTVKSDGTIICWGSNTHRQATPPAGVFTQVSAGVRHTCGLKTDGTITCWGSNNDAGGCATSALFPNRSLHSVTGNY